MDLHDSELEQIDIELETIFFACPCNQDGEVKIQVLLEQLAVKYGDEISECLKEELQNKCISNDTTHSVSKDNFMQLMKNIITANSEEPHIKRPLDFVPTEYIEYKTPQKYNRGSPMEEIDNNNIEVLNTLRISDISYCAEDFKQLRDSKEAFEKKLLRSEATVQLLEERLKLKNNFNAKLNKEIENLKGEINKFRTIEEECDDLKETIKKLEVDNNHINNDYMKANRKIEMLEEEIYELNNEIKNLREENSKKNLILKEIEDYNKSLYNEVNSIKAEKEQLKDQIKVMNSELVDKEVLLDRITELTSEKQNLQIQLSEISVSSALSGISILDETVSPETRMVVCTTPFTVDQTQTPGVSLKSELIDVVGTEDDIVNKLQACSCNQEINVVSVSTQTESSILNFKLSLAAPSQLLLSTRSCQTDDLSLSVVSASELQNEPTNSKKLHKISQSSSDTGAELSNSEYGSGGSMDDLKLHSMEYPRTKLNESTQMNITPKKKHRDGRKPTRRSLYHKVNNDSEDGDNETIAVPLEKGACDMELCTSPTLSTSTNGYSQMLFFTDSSEAYSKEFGNSGNNSLNDDFDDSDVINKRDGFDIYSSKATLYRATPHIKLLNAMGKINDHLQKKSALLHDFEDMSHLIDSSRESELATGSEESLNSIDTSAEDIQGNDISHNSINDSSHQVVSLQRTDRVDKYEENKTTLYRISYFSSVRALALPSDIKETKHYFFIWLIHELTKFLQNILKLCNAAFFIMFLSYCTIVTICIIGTCSRSGCNWLQCFTIIRFIKDSLNINLHDHFSLRVTYPNGPPPT